ncbi:MAG: ATP-dependent helicase, partial [Lachnospiraceae bacterium]|nr:ATP-dependent helicase [Lachnospiraceae bacterium]
MTNKNSEIGTQQHGGRIVLNLQQSEAVKTVNGPVLLLAVPGSGKTTVLVLRLGYMITNCGIEPENILTVTYTVAATRDMARRFAGFFGEELASRLEFRTINGICARIIGYYSRVLGKKAFELVTDEKRTAGILTQIYQQVEQTWPTEADLRNVRTLITYIKNQMLTEKEIRELGGDKGSPLREADCQINIGEIYERYNRWLREQHLMDYDDQMVYALNILRKVPQVLAHFQDQYKYICVDEAQDTSRIQHAIIALLASRYDNLFMVGDEDQSIYGFRAAYPEALLNFEKEHRGAKILLMEQNYRSGSGIVSAADQFIQRNMLRHAKHMVCAAPVAGDGFAGQPGGIGAAGTSAGEGSTGQPGVREIYLRGRKAQYKYLLKVADGCTEQTAVLYRNNESAIPLVDLLEREGIPYRIRNAEVGFFTHRTVMDITNIIKLAYDPYDVDAFWSVYYKLGMYLSKEKATLICDLSRRMELPVLDAALRYAQLEPMVVRNVKATRTHLEHMKEDKGDQAVSRIVKNMGYGEYLSRSGSRDSKINILTSIGSHTQSPAELLDRLGFLGDIFRSKEQDPSCPFILSTIHASKGLEYDTVYLMDVMDGIFPEEAPASTKYMSKEERRAFEEERRLFYVGMTRARNKLCVFTTDAKS